MKKGLRLRHVNEEVTGPTDRSHDLWIGLGNAAEILKSDPETAGKLARQFLKVTPAQQQALMLLVSSHRALGDLAGARAALEALAEATPELVAIQYELGALLVETGETEEAVRVLTGVVEREPKHPHAWGLLADALLASGDPSAAADAYVRQFDSYLMDLKTLEQVGALGPENGEIALKVLQEFLTIHPTDIATLHAMGKLCMRLNLLEHAERLFARIVELAPDFSEGVSDYHAALEVQMKWEQQLQLFNRLLELDPDDSDNLFGKALVLARLGDHGGALEICEQLVREHAGEPRFWAALGHALRTVGRQEESVAAYRKSTELDPGFGEGWWGLVNLKTIRLSHSDIQLMQAQLQSHDLTEDARCHLHFALGEAFEREQKYAESFEHYRQGNALRRSRLPHSADEMSANVQRVKMLYDRDFFDRHAGLGCPSVEPIFIVGLPRSGSTLIEQILARHSEVEGAGELPAFTPVAIRFMGLEGAAEPPLKLDAAALKAGGEEFLARSRIFRKLDRPFFTDKSPSNFHHLGLICAMLPNAKIIDVRRNPLDCCFSNYKQLFPWGLAQTYDQTDIARYYRDYIEVMAHFDDVLPGRIFHFSYEDLVGDPETQIRALLRHCGLEFQETCLRFYESDRPVFTASSEQVRRPLYADAIGRWRHYEPWLGPMKTALGPVLENYPVVTRSAGL